MDKIRLLTSSTIYRTIFGRRNIAYIICLTTITVTLLLPACSHQAGEIDAQLEQEFNLMPGQSASITGEALVIKFVEVVNDSRCPTGVTCFWEGEVTCLVEITYAGSKYRMTLTHSGSGKGRADFDDYDIDFEVQPYPEAGKQIAEQDYKLYLIISKELALSGGILVTFDVVGEKYSMFITNEETIEQVVAVQQGESRAKIPSGRILRGSVSYNKPWNWYIDPEDIHMTEFTIELCDGIPSQVEANLDYWVDTVQRFCPWSAVIDSIEDYR